VLFLCALVALPAVAASPPELRPGRAGHAFDHLDGLGEQAETAAACGANIVYVTGLGGFGYSGLPPAREVQAARRATSEYLKRARQHGIKLAIGYVCATSIVKLETFDRNWPPALRAQLHTAPAAWRQQDRQGRPLPSWYGGEYQPACLNHPDWRTYEKFIVRQQLESGCDGIFFDNPTVHPQGCYCEHCLRRFVEFLGREAGFEGGKAKFGLPTRFSLAAARTLAQTRTNDFLRFRCTIARDFLADLRAYARRIRPGALITANNSLNSPDVLYSQCRTYGYSPYEMSKAEDFVVVEDTSSQPRILPNGQTMEYGPTYRQLQALCHGKPLVAVTIAQGDYHTPPNLVRLAMAEAAAHDASYLLWPTWPEKERPRMIAGIRPQVELLRTNEALLNGARARRDAVLFLPFRRWVETKTCPASALAAALTRANVQYAVISEDDLRQGRRQLANLKATKVLVTESPAVFTPDERKLLERFVAQGGQVIAADRGGWLAEVQRAIGGAPIVTGPPTVRAVVRDLKKATVVHLLNLDVQRLSSFTDQVRPATDLRVVCRVPFARVRSVRVVTADEGGTRGQRPFVSVPDQNQVVVETTVPRLDVAAFMVIEP
jgi:hypothetical protein